MSTKTLHTRLSKLENPGGLNPAAELQKFTEYVQVGKNVLDRFFDRGKTPDDEIVAEAKKMQDQYGSFAEYEAASRNYTMSKSMRDKLDKIYGKQENDNEQENEQ